MLKHSIGLKTICMEQEEKEPICCLSFLLHFLSVQCQTLTPIQGSTTNRIFTHGTSFYFHLQTSWGDLSFFFLRIPSENASILSSPSCPTTLYTVRKLNDPILCSLSCTVNRQKTKRPDRQHVINIVQWSPCPFFGGKQTLAQGEGDVIVRNQQL